MGSQGWVLVIEVSTPRPRDARGRLGGGPPLPRILFSAFSLPLLCLRALDEAENRQMEDSKECSRMEENPSTPFLWVSPENLKI